MNIQKIDIKLLKPAEYNPRKKLKKSDKEYIKIKNSIEKFGYIDPIILNKDFTVIGGHQRLTVLKDLKYKEIDCVIVDISKEEEKALNIGLNKISGEWDKDLLKDLFLDLKLTDIDLNLTGFDDVEISELIGEELKAEEDDFEVPNKNEIKTDIVLGDLFEIGEHRLLCGDSTKSEDVEKLMNGEKADLGLTDPPYNIGYDYNSHNDNMTEKEYNDFIVKYVSNLINNSDKQIITSGKQNVGYYYKNFNITEFAVWYAKNKMSGSKISNLGLCEPILFIGKFNRNSRPTDMFEYNVKQQENTGGHTCPKIIDFFAELLRCYSEVCILDLFLGSGTTMVASHQLKRKCYGMELDPKYCQVIIDRMRKLDPTLVIKKNGVVI